MQIFHTADCPFRREVLKDMPSLPEIQEEYIKPNQNLFNYLSEKSGMKIRDPHDALELYFVLNTEVSLPNKETEQIVSGPQVFNTRACDFRSQQTF